MERTDCGKYEWVKVDDDKCVSCGYCVEYCPRDVLRMGENNRPYMAYRDDCWYCDVCRFVCRTGAIELETVPYLTRAPWRRAAPPPRPRTRVLRVREGQLPHARRFSRRPDLFPERTDGGSAPDSIVLRQTKKERGAFVSTSVFLYPRPTSRPDEGCTELTETAVSRPMGGRPLFCRFDMGNLKRPIQQK